ncbi:MAG: hypothetical protein K9M51_03845 [Candidatus Gracilibacteria bacterium]|nr:hypothetical protein [Candidatus Gracilibacteria bacterium]
MEKNEEKIVNLAAYRSGYNSGFAFGELSKAQRIEKAFKNMKEKNPYESFCLALFKGFHDAERKKSKSQEQRLDDLKNISKNKSQDKDLER